LKPPYQITPSILLLIVAISEKVGEVRAVHLQKPNTQLRKKNQIKTIQSSLEIEGNTLSIDQVTAIMDNKRVLAPEKDILEVQNAIQVYDNLSSFTVYSLTSFCNAHSMLMKQLIPNAGKLRNKTVGTAKGTDITHIAPPPEMVKPLMNNLFNYLEKDKDLLLIKSCVFHYELEFIHPFMDGNGRMGRLWQTLLLKEYAPVFEFLPVEVIIKQRQAEYYKDLSLSDKQGQSTTFIEFMLQVINTSLEALLKMQVNPLTNDSRIELYKGMIGTNPFSRQQYMRHFKNISAATASRDLKNAVDNDVLYKIGDKRMTTYIFYK
jgi:Fic family protein